MEHKITREQILELDNTSSGKTKGLLKEWFPDAFEPNFEIGQWYSYNNGFPIVNYQGGKTGFGFNGIDNWGESKFWSFETSPHKWNKLDIEIITERLIVEAKQRFGPKHDIDYMLKEYRFICLKTNELYCSYVYEISYDIIEDSLTFNGYVCYEKGKWAEVPKELLELTLEDIAIKYGVELVQVRIKQNYSTEQVKDLIYRYIKEASGQPIFESDEEWINNNIK